MNSSEINYTQVFRTAHAIEHLRAGWIEEADQHLRACYDDRIEDQLVQILNSMIERDVQNALERTANEAYARCAPVPEEEEI